MGYEIDFLPVGEGEKGGDAICLRYGDLINNGEQTVIVIDGGNKDSGSKLVEHIKRYYKTENVDIVISTHPDMDHASGLTEVLNNLNVSILLMHKPWEHSQNIKDMFQKAKVMTDKSLADYIQKSIGSAQQLEEIANEKKINIIEPFSDHCNYDFKNAKLTVLSPSKEYYESLLPNFRATPTPKKDVLMELIKSMSDKVAKIVENFQIETLTDPADNATSAENNSSVIFFLEIDSNKLLFTGDAGVPALSNALEKAVSLGIDLKTCNFVQIPHHGSKRNVGPSILNQIIGPKLNQDISNKTSFVSVPLKGEPKHPSKRVLNAFIRRGSKVIKTFGNTIHHFSNVPDREGWVSATPEILSTEFDEE